MSVRSGSKRTPGLYLGYQGVARSRETGAEEQMKKDDKACFALLGGFAALVIGAWAFTTWMPGTQVTDCSIGAYGPYAKVRFNSLTGGLVHGSGTDHSGRLPLQRQPVRKRMEQGHSA
jgi:hypothetical protein